MIDIDEYLKTPPKKVRENLTVIEPTNKVPHLLHITVDPQLPPLFPRVSKRIVENEDSTTGRVCVSAHLEDCISGYAQIDHLFELGQPNGVPEGSEFWGSKHEGATFTGGWYIYKIPFTYAFKPNSELVPSADETNEIWLLDIDNTYYVPELIGSFFLESKSIVYRDKKGKEITYKWYYDFKEPVRVNNDKVLEKGTYSSTDSFITKITENGERVKASEKARDYRRVPEDQYKEIKKRTVSMLSFENKFKW